MVSFHHFKDIKEQSLRFSVEKASLENQISQLQTMNLN